ncbi:MAG: exodeoxyribonuclease VII small subunit [Proteobacteria bacterium]|jgi:exodeoxyribonuclease VII small subunit|nr:exodeoxyribonuclease VII small subunit [Pseudomonadota bacterium]
MSNAPERDFEETLTELEKRIRLLEAGDISLDDALSFFEEGVELARNCHEHLEAAEKRVLSLTRDAKGIASS